MNEATKTSALWGALERRILAGSGIDIGCGPDPVVPGVRRFDREHGDANDITRYVTETFDFVFSAHCLEHMHDPVAALSGWWQLVKPGGHLFLIVPDEDLYEQGVFPSRFNSDHKCTFTIAKLHSWSPVSHGVLGLVDRLPGGRLVNICLQDAGYRRDLQRFGPSPIPRRVQRALRAGLRLCRALGIPQSRRLSGLLAWTPDQTLGAALAQIQCIVQKIGVPPPREGAPL